MFNIAKMMEEIKKVTQRSTEIKGKLDNIEVEGFSGGDFVKIIATGSGLIKKVTISDELFGMQDKKMLEDMMGAAIIDTFNKIKEKAAEITKEQMSGLPLPQGFENLFGDILNR